MHILKKLNNIINNIILRIIINISDNIIKSNYIIRYCLNKWRFNAKSLIPYSQKFILKVVPIEMFTSLIIIIIYWEYPLIIKLLMITLWVLMEMIIILFSTKLKKKNYNTILYKNYIVFFLILLMFLEYKYNIYSIQPIIMFKYNFFSLYNLSIGFYLDSLSLSLILLTSFLIPVIINIGIVTIKYKLKDYIMLFLILELLLILFFLITNIIMFYVLFEAILLPMLVIILIWGSRRRKLHAVYLFFFYTVFGSLIMLLGILQLYLLTGDFYIPVYKYLKIPENCEYWIFLSFFIAMGVKIPIFPVHTWLPEAHVEAPTGGSILLAGILLKLGIYGILRLILPVFKIALYYFTPIILTLNFISVIYISIIILSQTDLKKIIAYSSIAHMNMVSAGLVVQTIYSVIGGLFTMLSHGLISGLLFLNVGILYDRYGERNILYYNSVAQIMPLFSSIFFITLLSNMGLPGTSGFVGEFLLLLGFSIKSFILLIVMLSSLFLTTIYCIWLYNRIFFGYIKIKYILKYKDLTKLELKLSLILLILILYFGIYPNSIIDLYKFYYNINLKTLISNALTYGNINYFKNDNIWLYVKQNAIFDYWHNILYTKNSIQNLNIEYNKLKAILKFFNNKFLNTIVNNDIYYFFKKKELLATEDLFLKRNWEIIKSIFKGILPEEKIEKIDIMIVKLIKQIEKKKYLFSYDEMNEIIKWCYEKNTIFYEKSFELKEQQKRKEEIELIRSYITEEMRENTKKALELLEKDKKQLEEEGYFNDYKEILKELNNKEKEQLKKEGYLFTVKETMEILNEHNDNIEIATREMTAEERKEEIELIRSCITEEMRENTKKALELLEKDKKQLEEEGYLFTFKEVTEILNNCDEKNLNQRQNVAQYNWNVKMNKETKENAKIIKEWITDEILENTKKVLKKLEIETEELRRGEYLFTIEQMLEILSNYNDNIEIVTREMTAEERKEEIELIRSCITEEMRENAKKALELLEKDIKQLKEENCLFTLEEILELLMKEYGMPKILKKNLTEEEVKEEIKIVKEIFAREVLENTQKIVKGESTLYQKKETFFYTLEEILELIEKCDRRVADTELKKKILLKESWKILKPKIKFFLTQEELEKIEKIINNLKKINE